MIVVWVALGMIAWLALGLVVGMLAGRLLRGRQVHYPTRRQYCQRCMYVGPSILCGCVTEMRRRLEAGDVHSAMLILYALQAHANNDLAQRRSAIKK